MAKSKSKTFLPKKVAGFKVPKTLRRGKVAQFMASPVGIAVMVAAIEQLGEAAVERDANGTTRTRKLLRNVKNRVRHTAHDAAENAFSQAVKAGLNAFSDTLHEYRMNRRNGDWHDREDREENWRDRDEGWRGREDRESDLTDETFDTDPGFTGTSRDTAVRAAEEQRAH